MPAANEVTVSRHNFKSIAEPSSHRMFFIRHTHSASVFTQSTMFNALCENGKAEVANYPFCTIEPNVGIVAVPDERLEVSPDLCPTDL